MIFVTVGTEKFPFDRLIKSIDGAVINHKINQDIFAQIGNAVYRPQSFSYEKFITFDQMIEQIKKADIVVSHAGVGSAILSLNLGKVPIIFPRRHDLGEHLDNHQIEFARKMETTDKVIVAYEAGELIDKINNYHKIVANLKPNLESNRDKLVAYLSNIRS